MRKCERGGTAGEQGGCCVSSPRDNADSHSEGKGGGGGGMLKGRGVRDHQGCHLTRGSVVPAGETNMQITLWLEPRG